MRLLQRLVQETDNQVAVPADGAEQMALSQPISLLNLGDIPWSKLSEAIYSTCLRMLSGDASKLFLKFIQSTPERGAERVRGNPPYRILCHWPNPIRIVAYFWVDMEMSCDHYGNAYVAVFGNGVSTQLWCICSNQISTRFGNRRTLGPDARL